MAEHLSDLRGLFKDMDRDDALDYPMLYEKAVAEIERLRAALKAIRDCTYDGDPVKEIARKAYEQNGNDDA